MLRLIWYKAICELRVEASRRYLGIAWWILEPAIFMSAFYVVFSVGLRVGGDNFVTFLLCGLVPWKWFATTVQNGANVIVENRGLMNQVYFDKRILIGMLITVNSIKAGIVFALLLVVCLSNSEGASVHWVTIPVLMAIQLIFIGGVVSVAAAWVPLLPDLRLLIDNGILIMFFASGIFFDISTTPEHIQNLLYLNPMAIMLTAYRDVLLNGSWPDWVSLGWVCMLGMLLLTLGMLILRRLDRTFPKVIL